MISDVLNIDEMNDLNDLAVNFFKSYVDTYHHPKRYFTENITLAFLIPFLKERFPFVSPFETKLISGMIECVFHSTNEIGKWDFGIAIERLLDYAEFDERFSIMENRLNEIELKLNTTELKNTEKKKDEPQVFGKYHLEEKKNGKD